MAMDLNSPLAQAFINEGRKRGYSDVAIATTLGNSAQESGLNSKVRPGDNGTAFGGMQWRKDRFLNLQSAAAKMGVDYSDPGAQASHWYNELDGAYGSEKAYGDRLKMAKTPEEANNAVISALRPAGWTSDAPQNGHAYASRLAMSQEALRMLTGGQGAQPGTPQADLPAQGATEVAGPVAAPQSGFESFMSGGPGALFGAPQKDWNAADAMLGVGSALMARSNPQGASALAGMITKAKAALNRQVVKTDAKSGEVTTYDQNTGQFNTQKVFSREAPAPKEGDRKFFQLNQDTSDAHEDMANTFAKYRRLTAEGKMDFSVLNKAKNTFSEISNENLTEAQRNAVSFGIDMERLRNDKLRAAKGVQTEGDAQRAMNEIQPGLSGKFNNDAVLAAMDLGYAGAVRGYQRGVRNNEAITKKFGEDLAYTGYSDSVKSKAAAFDEDERTFTPIRENYRKTRASSAAESAASGNGRQQKEQPSSGPSLYDRHKARVGQ